MPLGTAGTAVLYALQCPGDAVTSCHQNSLHASLPGANGSARLGSLEQVLLRVFGNLKQLFAVPCSGWCLGRLYDIVKTDFQESGGISSDGLPKRNKCCQLGEWSLRLQNRTASRHGLSKQLFRAAEWLGQERLWCWTEEAAAWERGRHHGMLPHPLASSLFLLAIEARPLFLKQHNSILLYGCP